jgi:hypothetical protein
MSDVTVPPEDPPADAPSERPTRSAWVRIPSAILAAFVVASIAIIIWVNLLGDLVPDAVDNFVGSLLLFAAAPILTGVFLRGSRLLVRVAVGLASTAIWVYWLFLVLVPIT